jgi:GWxTD domain-containing protein
MRIAIGWTILHSLWQGALIALLLGAALTLIRDARARYAAACLSLLAILAAFGVTLVRTLNSATALDNPIALGLPPGTLDALDAARTSPSHLGFAPMLPYLAPLWIAGVILFHLYSLASWIAARRLLRRGVCVPPDPWPRRLIALRDRLRIPAAVTLLESCFSDVPVVIGYLRPVILVPVGLLAAMPADQVEAILLHELAHIRRRDYLVNLLQTVVEGFLFYHPAVWWISHVIRTERENCCDDLVVATSGDAHRYASALAALEQNRSRCTEPALAANGGNLMKRIRRLLDPLDPPRTALSPVLSAVVLTLTAALALSAWQANNKPAESPYQRWVKEDAAYIITDRERDAFNDLKTDPEREMFIYQFWERRNPTPGAATNPFKEEHYRRIAFANDHFPGTVPGWKTDRGRIYIKYGPPNEIESHPAGGAYKRPETDGGGEVQTHPFEQWRYRWIEGVGTNVFMEFVDVENNGDYHMTKDPHVKENH